MTGNSMNEHDRTFWLAVRQALLAVVDALETWLELEVRTSEMRKAWKHGKIQVTRKEC